MILEERILGGIVGSVDWRRMGSKSTSSDRSLWSSIEYPFPGSTWY